MSILGDVGRTSIACLGGGGVLLSILVCGRLSSSFLVFFPLHLSF